MPNSSAMDAAAGGSGPSATVLPWIVTTEPDQIQRYVTDLVSRVATLARTVQSIDRAGDDLHRAWSTGSASAAAHGKVAKTIEIFQKVTTAVQALEAEIQAVVVAVRMVQNGYRAVVGAVNPTVAALLSNIYTRAAATALAVSATSGLASFVSTVKAALDAIGLARIATIITTLVTIAHELQSLLSNDTPQATPATQPTALQALAGNGVSGAQPTALQALAGNGASGTQPTALQALAGNGASGTQPTALDSWLGRDPSTSATGAVPAFGSAGSGSAASGATGSVLTPGAMGSVASPGSERLPGSVPEADGYGLTGWDSCPSR
ncbi:hypothetical protein [Mangrovihabitans endophyticus]|uniref:hypothetical protein n=1 Tax=Mangrovihabitans endophyticus TaxID=1751298 RepID=UPI001663BDC4|nr:hypothetical protein [Mangrovihabitans endophyticus]